MLSFTDTSLANNNYANHLLSVQACTSSPSAVMVQKKTKSKCVICAYFYTLIIIGQSINLRVGLTIAYDTDGPP